MRKVRLKDGCDVWVSWLSAREGVEVRHTCLEGHGTWKAGEYVSPIEEVYPQAPLREVAAGRTVVSLPAGDQSHDTNVRSDTLSPATRSKKETA